MKRIIFIIATLFTSLTLSAQIEYIGNYVDNSWLNNNFGRDYKIVSGEYNENGYIINGRIVINNRMELCTSRNGRCDTITIEEVFSDPSEIQRNAEWFFIDNQCSIISRNIHDGFNEKDFFDLSYKGEHVVGIRLITLTARAHGSYNSYGEYFPSYYRKRIIATGL